MRFLNNCIAIKNNMKKIKIIGGIVGAIVLIVIGVWIYNFVSRPSYGNSASNGILFIIFGLVFGGIIAYLIFKLSQMRSSSDNVTISSSHTVVESMKKVFKIVVAEGQLNEVYNYENTKKLLKFIPSTKKALVIVRAKVMVGYDFEKCKWTLDENEKKIVLLDFPKPEILSLDPEYNYYYFEDDLFNFISREDLQNIQKQAREQVHQAALQSGLMKIAAEQMKTMLAEIVKANQWQIENLSLVENYKVALPAPVETAENVLEPTGPKEYVIKPAPFTDL